MNSTQTLEVPGYEVIQYLGSGARSTIWHIRDRQDGKSYALKRVIKRQSNDERFLTQVINEYEIGSQLDNDVIRRMIHLRRIKHWMQVREIHLLMEYCEGLTVQQNRPTDVLEVIRIFYTVAKALAYMNSKGFIHADIKPNNILVDDKGRIKIIDLGQSCRLGTIKERIQGTPDFISPEQVHRRPLDARTDVFNFGASLYWTLVARPIPTVLPPREDHNQIGKLRDAALKDMTLVAPSELNHNVPPSLNKLVLDCVEIHPKNRPLSMDEVASRLELITRSIKRDQPNQKTEG